MSLFRVFSVPLLFSLCTESTSYVLSFRMVFFYLVTTGWIFDISFCDNSISQSTGGSCFFFVPPKTSLMAYHTIHIFPVQQTTSGIGHRVNIRVGNQYAEAVSYEEIFPRNFGAGGVKQFPWKISSGAQSEHLGPSLTIQEFFQENIPGFICSVFRSA